MLIQLDPRTHNWITGWLRDELTFLHTCCWKQTPESQKTDIKALRSRTQAQILVFSGRQMNCKKVAWKHNFTELGTHSRKVKTKYPRGITPVTGQVKGQQLKSCSCEAFRYLLHLHQGTQGTHRGTPFYHTNPMRLGWKSDWPKLFCFLQEPISQLTQTPYTNC